MTEPWQTKLDTYSDFPRCCKSFQEMNDHTDNAYGDQTAFNCKRFPGYRIIEEECLGMECPDCQIIGIEEYNKHIKNRLYIQSANHHTFGIHWRGFGKVVNKLPFGRVSPSSLLPPDLCFNCPL